MKHFQLPDPETLVLASVVFWLLADAIVAAWEVERWLRGKDKQP